MANQLDKIADNVTTDVKKKVKSALYYAGTRVCGDFAQEAELALDRYYDEYDPVYYHRLAGPDGRNKAPGSLRDSYRKVVNRRDTGTGATVTAGIVFDPERMEHKHKGITEADIMNNFMAGLHYASTPDGPAWMFGNNAEGQLDKFYETYLDKDKPFEYFRDYMDTH